MKNKKMLKRSLALGALMAFVITGSAMAADESHGSTILTQDVTVTDGNLTYTATDKGADNPLGEGANRSYALGVVDGGSRTITLDSGKTLFVKNALEGTNRNYGIALLKNSDLTINGNVDVEVESNKLSGGSRAVRNNGFGTLTLGDVNSEINIKNHATECGGSIVGVGNWGGIVNFKGNTLIDVNAENYKGDGGSFAVMLGGGTINFDGAITNLKAQNDGYTVFLAKVGDGSNYGEATINFNSKETNILASSQYGASAFHFNGDVLNTLNFNQGDVNIKSIITDGVAASNAIGFICDKSVINVGKDVNNFNIIIEGSGQDTGDAIIANGTEGIFERGSTTNINSKNFTVKVTAGQDTENIKFDKAAADELAEKYNKKYNTDTHFKNHVDNGDLELGGTFYATSYGLYCYGTNDYINAPDAGQINVSANTKTVIAVNDAYKAGVGVYATAFYDVYGTNSVLRYHPGTINILGDADISAVGKEGAKALYARRGGTINVGSEGKTLNFVGDIVSKGKYDVENDKVNIHKVSTINLHGNSVFDGTKTQFITADGGVINLAGGNMSGSLNIANGSKVNLTGATFTANDLATGIVGDGKLVLTDNGVLSTTANQIFTKADTVGSDFVDNAITDTANKKVDFVSGTVSLTDKEYNFDFVQSAVATMQKHNSSKTNVVMTGTLVGGVEDNKVTVDEAAGLGNDVALDKVTAEAGGNLLVGSTNVPSAEIDGVEIKDSVANGFNVGSLELAAGSDGMVITNEKEVTLGGSEGGSVINVKDGVDAKVTVVVGTDPKDHVAGVTNDAGTLNIGNALADANTEYTLNGTVIVNDKGTLNTKGNTTITDDIELNGGTVNAVNGKLEANTIVVNEGVNTITGNVSGIFSAQQGSVTNVGTADASASTSFERVNLNGSTICFDPAWDKAAGEHGLAFENAVNGNVLIARNNYVAIGTSDTTAAKAMFEKTGLKFGEKDITAVLYIAGNQKLEAGKGSISIDGSKAAAGEFANVAAGSFNAAANSLTMVDGSKIKDTAALSGVTSTAIADGAKLYIDGAKKGETYKVIAGADAGWADKDIISSNSLLEFKGDAAADNKYDVTASLKKVNDVYNNKVIIANVVDNTLDKHEASKAADFFNAAVNNKINASSDAQISALNSAGAMNELAGVAHSTYAVSNILTDAVAEHVSLSNELEHDSDIWAHYVHNKEEVKGLPVAGFGADYDAKYNGIVVGGDFYKKDNVVAGAALTYVDASINGSSLAARTENDAKYYGVSLYGSVAKDNNAVIGDISYLHGKNEITQHNSGFALTGEPETDAFSVGVRVEKAIETDGGKFVPYAGLRYMHVGTGNYTNSLGMSYDADDANLFLLPVGLKYSAEAKVGSMTIRPVAEVGYVWAMGDTDSAQTVSLNGAADGFGYDVTDEGSYFARIGVEAVSHNVTYGLGYEYQKGDSVKANKWMANLNFSF